MKVYVGQTRSRSLIARLQDLGTRKRVRWARSIGADSVDSCVPLFSEGNLANFRAGLEHPQGSLWEAS